MARYKKRTGKIQGTAYFVIRPITRVDVIDPLIDGDCFPGRPGRHIAEHERIVRNRILGLKLCQQNIEEPPDPRFADSARVMRNKAGQAAARPVIADPPGTIERVKPRNRQGWRIANIMQIRSRNQEIAVSWRHDPRNAACLLRNLPHMMPAIPQGRQKTLGVGTCPRRQGHEDTVQPAT